MGDAWGGVGGGFGQPAVAARIDHGFVAFAGNPNKKYACAAAGSSLSKPQPRGTPVIEDDCMRQIPPGTKGTFTLRVLPEHLANQFKDAMLPQVLATPVMILIMENAPLAAILPFLDAGESAVGTAIDAL